jgi:inositol polyphosphate 5-phosphatase INPP5B/F
MSPLCIKYKNTLFQITVEQTDIDFGVIRFNELVSRELLVANNCHLPVNFQFSGKDGKGTHISESWIKISHPKGDLITGEQAQEQHCGNWNFMGRFFYFVGQSLSIRLDIMIDTQAAAAILHKIRDASSGVKIPLDILVLHVMQGRDIFITIFGEYKPSCFGLTMEALTKLIKPITHYELKDLMQIVSEKKNFYLFLF